MKRLAHILLYVLAPLLALSQDPYYIKIDKSKGLLSNSIYDIHQDSKGYIWIAHEEGLTRYDGSGMRSYECAGQTSRAGSDIGEDSYGRIWYENFDGYLYYVERDTMKALVQPRPAGFLAYGILEDRLFVVSGREVVIYDLASLEIVKRVKLTGDYVVSCAYGRSRFYVASQSLLAFSRDGKVDTVRASGGYNFTLLGKAMEARHNVVIYGKYNALKQCVQVEGNRFVKKFDLLFDDFIQAHSYSDSCYWFGTPKGVYAYYEDGVPLNKGQPFFGQKSISDVLRDREGNYWFGTTNEGVLLVPNLYSRIYQPGSRANKLARNGNTLFIGNGEGKLFSMDLHTMQPAVLFDDKTNKHEVYLGYDSVTDRLICSSSLFSIIDMKGRQVSKSGLALKDCYRINSKYFAFSASGVAGLFPLGEQGPNAWDSCCRIGRQVSGDVTIIQLLKGIRAKAVIYAKSANVIYFATNTGLYSVTLTGVKEMKLNGASLYASKLALHGDNVLILGTHGQLWETGNDSVAKASAYQEMLHGAHCKDFKVLGEFLFMVTNKGLLYTKLGDPTAALNRVGIDAETDIADIELWNGQLVLATGRGVIVMALEPESRARVEPLFHITSFRAGNRLLDAAQTNEMGHSENNVEIGYSIPYFRSSNMPQLYYRINDGAWETADAGSRTLRLAALAPGDYTLYFHLGDPRSSHETDRQLQFSIRYPWWRTPWATAGFVLLVLAAFTIIYQWQTGILKKQNQLLQQKFDLEKDLRRSTLKSIKAQMNPHFFYNALNTIQSFIFSDDKRNAATYLSKFSKLTRTILEMSEKELVSLAEELEALTLYLEIEKVRFDNDFDFVIRVGANISPDLVKIPSMIIQPYVENAVKHGLLHKKGSKLLHLDFSLEKNLLTVLVSDNGIGRLRSAELNRIKRAGHQPFATGANYTRLSILNKDQERVGVEFTDKKDEAGNPSGTDVELRIPLA